MASYDSFSRRIVPRWANLDEVAAVAYKELIETVRPCIVVAHSSASSFAYEVLEAHPKLVKSICLIEPSFSPPWPIETAGPILSDTPVLQMFGDFMSASPYWAALRNQARLSFENLNRKATASWIDLPERGICGNTHCPMSDDNADEVVAIVLDWIEDYVGF